MVNKAKAIVVCGKALIKQGQVNWCLMDSLPGNHNTKDRDFWTCSLITREAKDFFEEIHNKKERMLLVLDPNFEVA